MEKFAQNKISPKNAPNALGAFSQKIYRPYCKTSDLSQKRCVHFERVYSTDPVHGKDKGLYMKHNYNRETN